MNLSELKHEKLLCLIGFPLAHSLSPEIQNESLGRLGLSSWRYQALEVKPGECKAAFTELMRLGVVGFNVTTPHKDEAARLCGARLSKIACAIGAANTVARGSEGDWCGYNTDAWGVGQAVWSEFGLSLSACRAVVVGTGPAGRACCYAARHSFETITISRSKAYLHCGELYGIADWRWLDFLDRRRPTIILDARPPGVTPVLYGLADKENVFYMCLSYAGTPFARSERRTDGLAMLRWQAALSLAIWTKDTREMQRLDASVREGLSARLGLEGLDHECLPDFDPAGLA